MSNKHLVIHKRKKSPWRVKPSPREILKGGYKFSYKKGPASRVSVRIPVLLGKVGMIPTPKVYGINQLIKLVGKLKSYSSPKVLSARIQSIKPGKILVTPEFTKLSRPVYGGMFNYNHSSKVNNLYLQKKSLHLSKSSQPLLANKSLNVPTFITHGKTNTVHYNDYTSPKLSTSFSVVILDDIYHFKIPSIYLPSFKKSPNSLFQRHILPSYNSGEYPLPKPDVLDILREKYITHLLPVYRGRNAKGDRPLWPKLVKKGNFRRLIKPETKFSYMTTLYLKQFNESKRDIMKKLPDGHPLGTKYRHKKRKRKYQVISKFINKNRNSDRNRWRTWEVFLSEQINFRVSGKKPSDNRPLHRALGLDDTSYSKNKVIKKFFDEHNSKSLEDLYLDPNTNVWTPKAELSPEQQLALSMVQDNIPINKKNWNPIPTAPFVRATINIPLNPHLHHKFKNTWIKNIRDVGPGYVHVLTNYDSPWSLPLMSGQHEALLYGHMAFNSKRLVNFSSIKMKVWLDYMKKEPNDFLYAAKVKIDKRKQRVELVEDNKHDTAVILSNYELPANIPGTDEDFIEYQKIQDINTPWVIYHSFQLGKVPYELKVIPRTIYNTYSFPSLYFYIPVSILESIVDLAFPLPDEHSYLELNYLSPPFSLQKVETVGELAYNPIKSPITGDTTDINNREFIYPSNYGSTTPRKQGQIVSYEDQLAYVSRKVIETVESDYEDGTLDSSIYHQAKKHIRYDVFTKHGISKVQKKRGYEVTITNSKLNLSPKSKALDDRLHYFGREVISRFSQSIVASSSFPISEVIDLMKDTSLKYPPKDTTFIDWYNKKFNSNIEMALAHPDITTILRNDITKYLRKDIFFVIRLMGTLITSVEKQKRNRSRLGTNPTLTITFPNENMSTTQENLAYVPIKDGTFKPHLSKSIISKEGVHPSFVHSHSPFPHTNNPNTNFIGMLYEISKHPHMMFSDWRLARTPNLKSNVDGIARYREKYQHPGQNYSEPTMVGVHRVDSKLQVDSIMTWPVGSRESIFAPFKKREYKRQEQLHMDFHRMKQHARFNFNLTLMDNKETKLQPAPKITSRDSRERLLEDLRIREDYIHYYDIIPRVVEGNINSREVFEPSSLLAIGHIIDKTVSEDKLIDSFNKKIKLSPSVALSSISIMTTDSYISSYFRDQFISYVPSIEELASISIIHKDLIPFYIYKVSSLESSGVLSSTHSGILIDHLLENNVGNSPQ